MSAKKLAVIGMVLSLLFFVPLSPVAGLTLSIISLVKYKKQEDKKGMPLAVVGLVAGTMFLLLQMFVALTAFLAFVFAGDITRTMDMSFPEKIAHCGSLDAGLRKDVCLSSILYMHSNQTFPDDFCSSFSNADLGDECRAVVLGDIKECDRISNLQVRQRCRDILQIEQTP